MKTAEIVKSSKVVRFKYYREGNFIYQTDTGFEFPVPLEEVGKATMNAEDKPIYFMRWIRKHNEP